MKFSYSSEVDILKVAISDDQYGYGEDNEGIIVHHGPDGTPLSLEILDAKLFVMYANASLLTGKEITNPSVSAVPYTQDRKVSIRAIPKGDADLRFKYHPERDALTVDFGDAASEFCRRNLDLTVYYDKNELPKRLEILSAREFLLGSMQCVLLQQEVTVP